MEIGEKVRKFIEGYNPLERIVNIECDYNDEFAYVIYKNEQGKKFIRKMDFKPFVWVKNSACLKMCEGNRKVLLSLLEKFNIGVKKLQSENKVGKNHERLTNSYKYLFYAKSRMSWSVFQRFFTIAKTPIYPKQAKDKKDIKPSDDKEFLAVAPVEQFMIANGIRLFKGFENYDELKRMAWDIETTGLNPEVDVLDQIGIRTNKGFETIITVEGESKEEKKKNEIKSIKQFLEHIADEKPDILFGHNSEVFDFNFVMTRCAKHGIDFSELSLDFLTHPIYKKKKQSVLKLGGEVEYFYPTCLWGTTILDSMHAVRRAQASNSNIKSARLKYIADYLKLKKPNRVYVQGDKIGEIWRETRPIYAFNDNNGDYYIPTEERPIQPKYEMVSGKYIVERYLLDDIWETDKVELTLNQANFLIAKILPTTFQRACTMGTAGIWKLILLAWSYENDLAIPSFTPSHAFVGGLSRLLKTGYAANVAKLDYNSLYPSIMLTWWVRSCVDTTDSILYMLEYVLSNREKYKALKGSAGKEANKLKDYLDAHKDELTEEQINKIKNDITHWKAEKEANDNKQLPLKTLGNSIFGSFGAPNIFPLGDQVSAEFVTCTGRMALRLMIHHFKELGYEPIVGDTDGFNFQLPNTFRYTEDTPYLSTGEGRNYPKGKTYVGCQADVAEFENKYLSTAYNNGIQKMGLDIDEIIPASINLSRKNYIDVLDDGSIKLVGNTIKSRRLSPFIEKFFDKAIPVLAHNKGWEFIDMYYSYVNNIFNYNIPLKDIASKGKIKKTLEDYVKDCQTLTKSGSKKSRQAWYELALLHNLKVNMNDTVYYVNTGNKKNQNSDVKKILHQYTKINGEEVELKGKVKSEILKKWCEDNDYDYKSLKTAKTKEILAPHITREYEEIILNCKMIPLEIAESNEDKLCSDIGEDFEYNVEKYVEMFNKRVKPLLVCFHPDIRDKILVTKQGDRNVFTEKECELVSGYPNKEGDQDTYEQLMTPERREIAFWVNYGQVPPYIKECGIDWDSLVKDYQETLEREKSELFQEEDAKYLTALKNLTQEDYKAFDEDNEIPKSILDIVELHDDAHFYFKRIPDMRPSTGGSAIEDLSIDNYSFLDESEIEYENKLSQIEIGE